MDKPQLSASTRRSVASDPEQLEFVVDPRAEPGPELDARAAYAAVAELSPRLRQAIVAVDVVGLSYKQAARALRIRQGTVTSRVSRAREAVALALGDPG